jgi:polyisoprenoid-binding protein YceI
MSTSIPRTTDQPEVKTTRWKIDPTRSRVEFHTPTLWGLITVKGRFERYHGTLDLGQEPEIELTIEAASLTTNNKTRDKHLRSADFFDTETHPLVRFIADSATLDGERLTINGQLHTAGTSTPLDVNATLRPVDGELEVNATATADHLDLGMSQGLLGMIRTPSELIVHGRLVRDAE